MRLRGLDNALQYALLTEPVVALGDHRLFDVIQAKRTLLIWALLGGCSKTVVILLIIADNWLKMRISGREPSA
eukprot:CAMPEP_0114299740 /NCGR_PEP_ID=MMETSP0059-20121206/13144_1 /TAXON_ID=36894 /ORGANISM="Pyramimonas parkeae, Strain CCMP726" /LENGTH=72 /DNA_ID=CAMNT_0001422251 /DNA_START=961 /DNA_END=1179 /DNA_ORIENTATION=-